jgi:hypothetical protein
MNRRKNDVKIDQLKLGGIAAGGVLTIDGVVDFDGEVEIVIEESGTTSDQYATAYLDSDARRKLIKHLQAITPDENDGTNT